MIALLSMRWKRKVEETSADDGNSKKKQKSDLDTLASTHSCVRDLMERTTFLEERTTFLEVQLRGMRL